MPRTEARSEGAKSQEHSSLEDKIMAISRRCAALPRKTGGTPDEIIGYDERGLPSSQ